MNSQRLFARESQGFKPPLPFDSAPSAVFYTHCNLGPCEDFCSVVALINIHSSSTWGGSSTFRDKWIWGDIWVLQLVGFVTFAFHFLPLLPYNCANAGGTLDSMSEFCDSYGFSVIQLSRRQFAWMFFPFTIQICLFFSQLRCHNVMS